MPVANIQLYDYQRDAVGRMKNGCILCGGVGSGKSRTALAYYASKGKDKPLYIITTARKRDTKEWEGELSPFCFSSPAIVDSWNNIGKYADVEGGFFIFDEQRVVGNGVWVKSFLRIAKRNQWVLLSATPGDNWSDYIPVFLANGFYHNRSEFTREHIIYKPYTRYPQIDRYVGTGRLLRERNSILVNMDFKRETVSHHEDVYVPYHSTAYKDISRRRWNVWQEQPIVNASEYCYCLRRVVNGDTRRLEAVLKISRNHPRVIISINEQICENAQKSGDKSQHILQGKTRIAATIDKFHTFSEELRLKMSITLLKGTHPVSSRAADKMSQ